MKRSILLLFVVFGLTTGWAQAPYQFNFQAVARNLAGNPMTNTTVDFRLSIVQGDPDGAVVYIETQSTQTNNFGLANLLVGSVVADLGTLAAVDWMAGPYFLRIELADNDGNYLLVGSSPLMSVPYALHAKTSEQAGPQGPPGEQGPQGEQGLQGEEGPQGLLLNGAEAGNTPYWNGSQWMVGSSNIFNNGESIGMGTTNPDASAQLEVSSNTQGFLLPRMTKTERDLISAPALGLLVFQTDDSPGFYFYDGTNWVAISGSNGDANSGSNSNTLIYTTDGF